jgi:hypothetical protein
MAEKFVDGLIPRGELHQANASAWMAHKHFTPVLMGPFMASASPRLFSAKMGWATALACAGGEDQFCHIWHDAYEIWRLVQDEATTSFDSEYSWQPLVEAFLETFELQLPLVKEHFRSQTDLLRDIFGNPFHSIENNPNLLIWNQGLLSQIAQEIYETRRFGEIPILADALEDAGCRSEAILEHCRSNKPHARGCWVVDLLLGKS